MSLIQPVNKVKQIFIFCLDRQYHYIVFLSIIVVILSSKGISDENNFLLNDDMPRYLMNGVYFYDVMKDLPLSNFVSYTIQYFARYPALSLGHHPILPGVALVPFYAIFGISVFSAKLMMMSFLLVAVIFWFLLIRSFYDKNVAFLSSLLFITTPYIVYSSRIVMSEIPCLAVIILTFYFLSRFCITEEKKYLIGFALALVASVYAKHTAIYMFPFYLAHFMMTKGTNRIHKKDIFVFFVIITLCLLPLIPITLKFSQFNVALIKTMLSKTSHHISLERFSKVIEPLYRIHLTTPVLIFSLISVIDYFFKRTKQDAIFLLWIIFYYAFSVFLGLPAPRHTIYWIPAFCILATTIIYMFNHRLWKVFVSILIVLTAGYQFTIAYQMAPSYARGVEETAKYVVNNWKGDSVMYNFIQDSGGFIFFLRKHSQKQNHIVLRTDKILLTSQMNRIIEERVNSEENIYDIFDKFGVAYVVTINLKYSQSVLRKLEKILNSERFVLRKKIPFEVSNQIIPNLYFSIYEYKKHVKANPDAILDMNIPLMADSITLRVGDLLKESGR